MYETPVNLLLLSPLFSKCEFTLSVPELVTCRFYGHKSSLLLHLFKGDLAFLTPLVDNVVDHLDLINHRIPS
jgi:hypothetical protein